MESNLSIIIDFLMKGSISIIGVIVGYFIAKNKYIFQKTYDQKLILITELYTQIVSLEFELKKYIHIIGADMTEKSIDEKIKSLNEIKNDFNRFQRKFWEVEIILDDSSINEINNFLKKYIEITSNLTVANILHQQGDNNQSFDNWNKSFVLVKSDLSKIKDELKKEFRKTLKK